MQEKEREKKKLPKKNCARPAFGRLLAHRKHAMAICIVCAAHNT